MTLLIRAKETIVSIHKGTQRIVAAQTQIAPIAAAAQRRFLFALNRRITATALSRI